ncbi:hypothetical protein BEWA_035370 [Theileria equi strain WA]|uniref:Uncharacterized protein n=1 Tax=Theileria equi strain WA TaxID=1537102 RepID=L1LDR9_THEEQ|nr:hypothetical protein BEWA_035370 [Theileria equi strain WA]EKX73501.1 hypothetical protein BEWA_035370 [Theileria equi strain WA]|eukprot:XP_004832953.1 hypothetical protein BEWA_035370 [Theileria equi strain WA]
MSEIQDKFLWIEMIVMSMELVLIGYLGHALPLEVLEDKVEVRTVKVQEESDWKVAEFVKGERKKSCSSLPKNVNSMCNLYYVKTWLWCGLNKEVNTVKSTRKQKVAGIRRGKNVKGQTGHCIGQCLKEE